MAPTLKPNLRNANLTKADLRKANLCDVCLRGANLEGANLVGATLDHIDLRDVPWLIIMDLTLQPNITWKDVLYTRASDGDLARSNGSLDDGRDG